MILDLKNDFFTLKFLKIYFLIYAIDLLKFLMLQSVKKRGLKKTKVIRFNPNILLMFAKSETQKKRC